MCRAQLQQFCQTVGPTLQASGVRMIALVKEAEFANDLLRMDGYDDPVWTGEIYVDHTMSAFAAMGAGRHQWRFFPEMCNPAKVWMWICKQQVRVGAEVLDQPGHNIKGEGFLLGGCWIIRKKGTGQSANDLTLTVTNKEREAKN